MGRGAGERPRAERGGDHDLVDRSAGRAVGDRAEAEAAVTTRIPASRLTVDHHGLHITVLRRNGSGPTGRLTDTLIGEVQVELWIDNEKTKVGRGTLVQLDDSHAA